MATSNELTNEYSPLTEMRLLAEGQMHSSQIAELNGKDAENQAKLFLVAQARSELQRILRLTQFLDSIEEKFMKSVNKQLIEQPDNINLIMTAMDITTQSLKRSNELVASVLKDDSLQTLVVNTVNLAPGVEQSSILTRDCRDAIRSAATSLIKQLQSPDVINVPEENVEIVKEAEVIEPTETNNTTDETNANNIKKAIDDKLNELLS
jgi:hypothetical protein